MIWNQNTFNTAYSLTKTRVPKGHPEFGNSYSYGWKYFRYCSRYSVDGIETIGFATQYRIVNTLINLGLFSGNKSILIVGCGIGATIHYIQSNYPDCIVKGTDISDYIHSIKSIDAPDGFNPDLVVNKNVLASDSVATLGTFDLVICELLTEVISLVNRPTWYSSCDKHLNANGKVVHIIMSKLSPELTAPELFTSNDWTYQSIDEWSLEALHHNWIDISQTDTYHLGGA